MANCPTCNIELVDNKCPDCGYEATVDNSSEPTTEVETDNDRDMDLAE